MKKNLFLCLSLTRRMTSCTKEEKTACYQCYYGNRIVSKAAPAFDSIEGKELERDIKNAAFDSYYFSVTAITSEQDKLSFESHRIWKDNQKDNRELPNGYRALYFFVQIPNGYRAFKRNNIQSQNPKGDLVLLTDNFYYYRSRPELSICYIDVVQDSEAAENVFSFYYLLPIRFQEIRKIENIRAFLSDQKAEEPNLKQNPISDRVSPSGITCPEDSLLS